MTETVSQLVNSLLNQTPCGLEALGACQVKPLSLMTLCSAANRFLRLEFPPQRNFELQLHLVNKGLLNPQFSKSQLQQLPLKTIEQLAQLVFQNSLQQMAESDPTRYTPQPALNEVLTLIQTLDELEQFDCEALVSEDLALLETHQQGVIHGFYFKPTQNVVHLTHVLQTQGFRTDFMPFAPDYLPPLWAYWLCRRLSVVLPWDLLLQHADPRNMPMFPHLVRLRLIRGFLDTRLRSSDFQVSSAQHVVTRLIPQLNEWRRNEFPRFSQDAHVPAPVRELVLVEGSTEELLLPAIARALDYHLDYEGILVQSVGGKNQMLQQYVKYAEQLAVPISIVLDKDAQDLLPDLAYYQRGQDRIFILEEGEFEDIYALDLIVKTVNEHYQPLHPLTAADLRRREGASRVKVLQALWQDLGLGMFDKVEFAQHLARTLTHENLLSPPMKRLLENIVNIRTPHADDGLRG